MGDCCGAHKVFELPGELVVYQSGIGPYVVFSSGQTVYVSDDDGILEVAGGYETRVLET